MNQDGLRSLLASSLRVPRDSVTRDADLVFDLGADSLSLAEISGVIERETRQRIPADVLSEITTVGDLEDLLSSLRDDRADRRGDEG